MTLLLCVIAAHSIPPLFPDPALAFYIARGWLGVMLLFGLWRGWSVGATVFAVAAVFEASTALCGSLYPVTTVGFEGLCDKGTGLPLTLPVLAGALASMVVTIRSNKPDKGR